MKNRHLLLPLAALALAFVGCGDQTPLESQPQFAPAEVIVAKPAVRSVVEWERFTGRLSPVEMVEIQARVSGHLQSIHFREGDLVNTGDLLFVIDPRPFEVARASALASEQQAQAELARANALKQQSEAEGRQADAAEGLARTRLKNARAALKTNSIAKEQVSARESEHAQAQAAQAAATAAVASAEADIVAANAAIAAAAVRVTNAELDLEYTRIEAPISGRISRRETTKGNLIQGGAAGATVLTTIVSLDPIHVYVDASERSVMDYVRNTSEDERRRSQEFRFPMYLGLLGDEGFPHKGQFDFAENRVDPATGTLALRGIFPNKDLTLIPGMFASVRLAGPTVESAVLIPDAAIGADQSHRYVLVVDDQNVVSRRSVITGPIVDGLRLVRSGLDGSENIVISGQLRAMPGMAVAPTPGDFLEAEVEDGLPNDNVVIPKREWIKSAADPEPIPVEGDRR